MSDKPKNWLVEDDNDKFVMVGFATDLAAAVAWKIAYPGREATTVKVSELLPGIRVDLRTHIEAAYR